EDLRREITARAREAALAHEEHEVEREGREGREPAAHPGAEHGEARLVEEADGERAGEQPERARADRVHHESRPREARRAQTVATAGGGVRELDPEAQGRADPGSEADGESEGPGHRWPPSA